MILRSAATARCVFPLPLSPISNSPGLSMTGNLCAKSSTVCRIANSSCAAMSLSLGHSKLVKVAFSYRAGMPASSSSFSDRTSRVHSQRSAPETPSRSTIFHPVPLQFGQTCSAMTSLIIVERLTMRAGLLDDCQHCSRAYGFTFPNRNRNHVPVPLGLHLILHLHGLYDEHAMSGFDNVTRRHQDAHDFSWHGRHDTLAFFATRSCVVRAPLTRIGDGHVQAFAAHRDPDTVARRFYSRFITAAADQHRE